MEHSLHPSQHGSPSGALAAPLPPPAALPNPEVTARLVRRRFSAQYKRAILDQVAAAQDSGAVDALLRREGLYSSHLTTWKRQRAQGERDALTPKKRGPKSTLSPLVAENRKLAAANARLIKKLKQAELIIEVQKKVAALLGNPIPNIQIDVENG